MNEEQEKAADTIPRITGRGIINSVMSRKIYVTFDRVGFHCYPNAPDEVAYLRERHRHLFKFKVEINVEHNERDIEFHMFKSFVEDLYPVGECQGKSCETMASEIACHISSKYPNRYITVEVSEDGECGAKVTYGPAFRYYD